MHICFIGLHEYSTDWQHHQWLESAKQFLHRLTMQLNAIISFLFFFCFISSFLFLFFFKSILFLFYLYSFLYCFCIDARGILVHYIDGRQTKWLKFIRTIRSRFTRLDASMILLNVRSFGFAARKM